jgi:hypothetical protein
MTHKGLPRFIQTETHKRTAVVYRNRDVFNRRHEPFASGSVQQHHIGELQTCVCAQITFKYLFANLKKPKLINNNNTIRQIQYKFINPNTTNINETTLSTIKLHQTKISCKVQHHQT